MYVRLLRRICCRANTGNTFTFPDSSDIDGEEDYDFSDMEESEQPSEDGVSMESQSIKSSRAVNAIDLTRDDSPITSSSAHIDLTGDTPAEKHLMELMAGHPGEIDDHADPASVSVYAVNDPILLESDNEGDETHFSSDSDDQYDEPGSDNSRSSEIYGMDNAGDSETGDTNEDQTIEGIVKRIQEINRLSSVERYAVATHENQPVLMSDLGTRIEASEKIMDDADNQSDFGLSEAGAEGIRALFEDGLLQNHENNSCFEEEDKDENESSSVGPRSNDATGVDIIESPKHVTFAILSSEQVPEMTSSFSLCQETAERSVAVEGTAPQFGDLNWRGSQSFAVDRQPSPSDAAMVKTAVPTTDSSIRVANPVEVHHLPSQDWRHRTAQYLGDKTGKRAFFEAREGNKAQIHAAESNQAEAAGSVNTQTNTDPISGFKGTREELQEIKRQRSMIAMNKYRERKRRLAEQNTAPVGNAKELVFHEPSQTYHPSPSTATFSKIFGNVCYGIPQTEQAIPPLAFSSSFLNDPSQAPILDREPSPLPDMSSAAKYNESKASMAAATSKPAPVQSVRSGLRIDDIIEDSSTDQNTKDLKRKADEISDVIENDVRTWASSPPVEATKTSPDMSVLESQAATAGEASEIARSTVSDAPEHRPAKRLKKFAEVVGYFALGGAAVGASMFSFLVATAPDFM